jgi:CRP-like cAMP-binding protein
MGRTASGKVSYLLLVLFAVASSAGSALSSSDVPDSSNSTHDDDGHDDDGHGDDYGGGHGSGAFAVFTNAAHLDILTISLAFVAVIGLTMGFEAVAESITHYTNEWASEIHAKVVNDVVTKLYRELTILGFISFTLMMLLQSQVLGAASNEVHAFEFAHVATFFIALLFIMQTVIFIYTTHSIKSRIFSFAPQATSAKEYEAMKGCVLARLQRMFERFQNGMLFTQSRAFDEMCHYILRSSFLVEYSLPAQFNFRLYVCKGLDQYMVHLMDPSMRSWGFLLVVVFLNILRYKLASLSHLGEYLFFIAGGWVLLLAMVLTYLRAHALKVDVVFTSCELKSPRSIYRLLLAKICCCGSEQFSWQDLWDALDSKQEGVFKLKKASVFHASENTFEDTLAPPPEDGTAGSAIRQRAVMQKHQNEHAELTTQHRGIDVAYEAGLYALESRIKTWRMRQRVKLKTKAVTRRKSLQMLTEALGVNSKHRGVKVGKQVSEGRMMSFQSVMEDIVPKSPITAASARRRLSYVTNGVKSRLTRQSSRHVQSSQANDIASAIVAAAGYHVGDRVRVVKEGTFQNATAVVTDSSWGGRLKVKMDSDCSTKSYLAPELEHRDGASGDGASGDYQRKASLDQARLSQNYEGLDKVEMFKILVQQAEQLSFLKELDEEQQRDLAQHLTPMTFADGEMLIRENDEITSFACCYIIREGELVIRQQSQVVALRKAGQFIGEQALISNSKRTADCIAKGEVKVLAMKMSAFASFMKPFWDRMGKRAKTYERFNFDLHLMPNRTVKRITSLHAMLELLILLNGTYLSIVFAFFIPNIVSYVDSSLRILTAILMIVPSLISICILSPPLLRDLSCLHLYSAIDVNVLEEVVQQEIALLRIQEWVISTLQFAMEREEGDGIDGADRLFSQFDHDQSRSLGKSELRSGLETLNIFLPRKDFETFFRMLDTENRGIITFEQFCALLSIEQEPGTTPHQGREPRAAKASKPIRSSWKQGPNQIQLKDSVSKKDSSTTEKEEDLWTEKAENLLGDEVLRKSPIEFDQSVQSRVQRSMIPLDKRRRTSKQPRSNPLPSACTDLEGGVGTEILAPDQLPPQMPTHELRELRHPNSKPSSKIVPE